MEWEIVIGLEIHAQLATRSKIFSGSSTAYGAAPNTQANLVDLGYPGVLPVLNREAVTMAVKFGLAIGAEINDVTRGGTKCTTFAECRDLIVAGDDIDYDGRSGPLEFIDAGEPSQASILILQFDETGTIVVAGSVQGSI